jgi:cobalt-precorrin-5B (C1)-methyltransferase
MKNGTTLRTGFTTGACAAAAARAAWDCLAGRPAPAAVAVRFPDGNDRAIPLAGARRDEPAGAEAWVVKDAGDDPDVTHGAVVRGRISPCAPSDVQPADFVEACNSGQAILRAGAGVGLITRPGLEVPPGKWALNPVPRRMIAENLALAGCGADGRPWLVTIGIDGGVALAARTLNPVLGIVNGLSILGTSGLVVPCSNAAYVATIRILLRGARALGCTTAVLATGGRTHRGAQPYYPALPEPAFIRIGDFIREAIEEAAALGFERIAVACMPGKLAKYAQGLACTHAHRNALSLPAVVAGLVHEGLVTAAGAAGREPVSVRGLLDTLDGAAQTAVLERWAQRALDVWAAWAPRCRFDVLVFETDGRRIGQWKR